jgi:hypothetical protein
LKDAGLVLAQSWDSETAELAIQANLEETEISVGKDPETTDLPLQDDSEIPF